MKLQTIFSLTDSGHIRRFERRLKGMDVLIALRRQGTLVALLWPGEQKGVMAETITP
jgi:hypothetical protein